MHTRPVTEEVAGSVVGSEQIGSPSAGLITRVVEPRLPAAGDVEAHPAEPGRAVVEPALPAARGVEAYSAEPGRAVVEPVLPAASVIEAHPAAPSLFAGVPPLLMLTLGVIIGAAVSFAVGVVVWSVFG